jgi:hypothetical protein
MDMSGKTTDSVMLVFVGLIVGGALLASGVMSAGYALALAAGMGENACVLAGVGSLFVVCSAALVGAEIHDRRQQKKWAAERKAREETAKQLGQGLIAAVPAPGKLSFVNRPSKRFSAGQPKAGDSDNAPPVPPSTAPPVWKK